VKQIRFTRTLTAEDWLDITLLIEKKEIRRFALNYRAFIRTRWYPVYRVDNFHGFLHKQEFWRTPTPIPLKDEEILPVRFVIEKYVREIKSNFLKYRSYFERAKKK
jgi:hypothetical protein